MAFYNTSTVLPLSIGVLTIIIGALIVNYLKKDKKSPAKSVTEPSELSSSSTAPRENAPSISAASAPAPAAPANPTGPPRTLLDPNEKYMLPLIEKHELSHDTFRYRFGLPSKDHILGLPIGQHVHLIATINGELVLRAYTPVSSDDDLGYVDLVIKVYKRNVHPKFPDGGKMSQFVDALKIGETIAFRGPTGKLQYLGDGSIAIKKLRKDPPQTVRVDTINMIAGGTGITPMLQLARAVLKSSTDKTKLALLFANQTESDILLRQELDDLAAKHPEQFKVWYTLDTVTDDWKFSKGFVSEEMISANLHGPADGTIVLMCGPPPMINFACQPNLEKLGYPANLRFAY